MDRPMKTWIAVALTPRRMQSSMSMAVSSSESSFRILGPPEALMITSFVIAGGITLRSIPRVHMSVSQ
jgi:hypothetical protein